MASSSATSRPSFTVETAPARPRATPLLTVLFLIFTTLVILRVAAGSLLLDQFMDYTTDSGSPFAKLHPTFYGFVAIALIALPTFRIELNVWELRVVRALMAFNAGIVLILVMTALDGRGGSAGFLIDSYCGASFVVLLFLFPPEWRARVGQALLLFLALNVPLAIGEFVLKTRLLPFNEDETAFRPIALSSHPLDLGLWMAIGPCFTAATNWSRRMKLLVSAIFLAGLGVAGARTALVVGLAAAVVVILGAIGEKAGPRQRLAYRLVAVCALVAMLPLALLALASLGGLDRFGSWSNDANAQTRINIYGVFSYMSSSQILFGMDPNAMRRIAKSYLRLEVVESPVVMFVTLFGAIGTALFVGLLARVLRAMLIGARSCILIGTGVFFVIALSSNGLSAKGSSIFMLFMLITAFRPDSRRPAWS